MPLLPSSANLNARRVLAAKALRAIADGYVSILLPAYLLRLGLSALQVGAIATATLLGSAAATVCSGVLTARLGHRRALLAASVLMTLTGLSFASIRAFWPLLLIAFIGTLNPSSGDVSIFLPLEQSLLSQSTSDRDRTALFARYNVVSSIMGALGTLFAAAPDWVAVRFGASPLWIMQAMFLGYALLGLSAGVLYRRLIEPPQPERGPGTAPLGPSRRIVYQLAALFGVDAFGGGFIVQSILALWLLKRFHFSVATIGALFFWSNLLIAVSYLAAPAIASRIGLIRTMVFTHLPSNLCLLAIPFTSKPPLVIALLLVRSLLSQMDVPTRSSYVMALVTPPERPAAAAITSVPRSLTAAVSPTLAGYLLTLTSFGWPLLISGALKIIYDLTLLVTFRHVRPPEEISSLPVRGSRDHSIREK